MRNRSWIAALSACLLIQIPGVVYAQDEEIEEIVVLGLAERYGSGLARAEFALGAEDIELRPAGAEITQALAKIPGVQVSTGDARGGSFSLELYLRGLNDNQIGLSVDGIPAGDARFNGGSPPNRYLDGPNVGTVRVSQSSGQIGSPSRSALGGFIDFRTMDPTDAFGGEFQMGTGSFDFKRLYMKVNTGELADGLTSYWSFSDQSNDIFAGPKSRDKNRQHFDGKIVKNFDSGTSIRYRISYNELDDNDFGIVSLGDYRNNPASDTVNDVFAGDPGVDGGFTGFGGALGGLREDLLTYLNADFVLSDTVGLSINPYYHDLQGESYAYQTESSTTESGDPRDQSAVVESEFDAAGNRVADMRVTPRNRSRRGVTAELTFDDIGAYHDIRAGLWLETDDTNEDRNFYRVDDVRTGIEYSLNSLGYIEYERSLTTDTLYYYIQDTIGLMDGHLTLDVGATVHDIDYSWRSPIEFTGENSVNASTDGVDLKLGGRSSIQRPGRGVCRRIPKFRGHLRRRLPGLERRHRSADRAAGDFRKHRSGRALCRRIVRVLPAVVPDRFPESVDDRPHSGRSERHRGRHQWQLLHPGGQPGRRRQSGTGDHGILHLRRVRCLRIAFQAAGRVGRGRSEPGNRRRAFRSGHPRIQFLRFARMVPG